MHRILQFGAYRTFFDIAVKCDIAFSSILHRTKPRYQIEMKNRIRELREAKGLSQEALGEIIGAHWQTVHRAESGKTALSESKLAKYAEALEVGIDDLMAPSSGRMVVVKGYVEAGAWAETWEWDEDNQYQVPVPDEPQFRGFTLHAAETRGPSMNKRYPEGTVIVFTDIIETQADIIVGKRYIVERERADGMREATVKQLWQDETGKYWLLPESTDPLFQEPIPINGNEDDTIRIVGRVRFAVSREE
jgi:transcriptional regulator with XRE-family HTH domain